VSDTRTELKIDTTITVTKADGSSFQRLLEKLQEIRNAPRP
jgi:hypothetical protein